jgi:hypothetical protein
LWTRPPHPGLSSHPARTALLRYHFDAKLGIEGADVRIEQRGCPRRDDSSFIFIGHDDVSFKLAAVDGGLLSWTTPEIDNFETINRMLDDEARQENIDTNQDRLRAARNSFTGVIVSIEPTLDVAFEFSD